MERPIVATSISLSAGFLVLVFSECIATRIFGVLSAITPMTALLAVLLLPSLLELARWRRRDAGATLGPATTSSSGEEKKGSVAAVRKNPPDVKRSAVSVAE